MSSRLDKILRHQLEIHFHYLFIEIDIKKEELYVTGQKDEMSSVDYVHHFGTRKVRVRRLNKCYGYTDLRAY